MYSSDTRNEFIRLRTTGLSLGSISRRLGISKPTLIAWNRQAQSQIQAAVLADQQLRDSALAASTNDELASLQRKLTALKQELLSRSLRDCSTPVLEQLAGQVAERIQKIQSLTNDPEPNSTAPVSPAASTHADGTVIRQESSSENQSTPNKIQAQPEPNRT